MTIKGKPLPESGTVGICSPSWCYYNRSEILRGVEWWEQRGYEVKLPENIFARRGYVAGSPQERGASITAMFADPDVDIVQCADAGFGAAHTLPHIDFDVIAQNPKAFIGFSDITALHTAIRRETGLVTFYGPLLTSLNQADQKRKGFSETEMLRAITSAEPMGEVPRDPDDPYVRSFNSGKATGQLAGGCLWLLNHAIGTPWAPDLAGKVFFFEDVSSAPWFIDAALTQLKQTGMLDEVIAVVVGQMEAVDWREWHDWPQVMSIEDILEEHLEPLGVPMVYGLPLGHAKYLSTLPIGVTVEVDADSGRVTVTEAALER